MDINRKPITISEKLFNTISARIKNHVNGFNTIEEYVDYVLEEVLFGEENNEIDEEERKKIHDELKKLGYI